MCRCFEVLLITVFALAIEVITRIIDDQVAPKQPNNVTSDRSVAKWLASRKSSHELYAESRIARMRDSSTDGLLVKPKQNNRTQVTTKKLDSLINLPPTSSAALLDLSLLYPMRSAKPQGGLAFPPVLPLLTGPEEQLPLGTIYA